MDSLFQMMERRLEHTPVKIIRSIMDKVNWEDRLVSIRGSRGVGKTTLLLQYIKLNYPAGTRKALFCALDNFYFNNHTLLDLARRFYLNGGRHLFLDEVHKYINWQQEIKEIYDVYPDMRVVLTGSSIIQLIKGNVDLSRRCLPYYMPGLSLREYLCFYHNIDLHYHSFEELVKNAGEIASEVRAVCSPVAVYHEYLRCGYYPFYNGNKEDYYLRIENVVNYIVEQELPFLADFKIAYARKIKALLSVMATSKPFLVDLSKLAKILEINRETVLNYLQLLSKGDLLRLLYSDLTSVKKMQKPDKIFLHNPNLLHALSSERDDVGNMRETFAASQLGVGHVLEYGKEAGDFVIDNKWRIEIGGPGKGFSQIAGIDNSFVFADDIEYPSGNKLPLWLLGFLY